MFYLIKKDMLIQKKAVLLSALLIIFFSLYFFKMGPVGLPMSVLPITYMLTLSASAIDEKNNGDKLLISLPIKKSTVVLSKYLSILLFTTYVLLINLIIHLLDDTFNLPLNPIPITFGGIVGSLIASILFGAISLPLIFKFGYLKSRMINFFLFFIVIFGGVTWIDYVYENNRFINHFFSTQPDTIRTFVVFILALAIYAVSYYLSYFFYKHREF